MRNLILIAHNIRSCHNVGSLLRTADGLGVERIYLTGYTPFPVAPQDARLPHLRQKIARQIHKTALGAEQSVVWEHRPTVQPLLAHLQSDGYRLCALEQSPRAVLLPTYQPADRVALIVGREVDGIEPEILALADDIVEIPMFGSKESYNVVQAAAIALYDLRVKPLAAAE